MKLSDNKGFMIPAILGVLALCILVAVVIPILGSIQDQGDVDVAKNLLESNGYIVLGAGSTIASSLIPSASATYDLGSIAALWKALYVRDVYFYDLSTWISRDGLGNMIFNDAVTGTKTLAQLASTGSSNITGSGTNGYIAQWSSNTTLINGTNTNAQVSSAVSSAHTQGSDTTLGVIATNISMNNKYINSLADPSAAQDAATKNYVDTHPSASGNVTASGNVGYVPLFSTSTNITNAAIFNNVTAVYITNDLLTGAIHATQDIDSDQDINATNDLTAGNDLDVIDDAGIGGDLIVVGTVNATRIISTQTTGTAPFIVASTTNVSNLNADLLDGFHATSFVAGTGNVTSSGMTTGYIPVSTSTTGITNSIMTSNGTVISIPIVTGVELCPTIAAANWTGGAGWTVNTGNLTRIASAVTTAYPTVAIVPDVTANYLVTFTISGYTAGTVTMTFGGVVSSGLQGNQNVYLYVSPYTTDNLIITPSASFAGEISAVSVKLYTGGELLVDGGMLYYDSRGHPNRLSHVTRHLSEMQTDTLLDKSRSTLTCAGGVLTYTLYAVYGQGTWNFDGIVYPGAVASANVTLTGGSNAVPKTNWVYFYLNGNTPTLASSITEPTVTPQIMVAEFIVGNVSGSSYNIYGYNRARTEVDSFVKRVIGRFENSGSLYLSGSLPTVTSSNISIASGGKWYQGIFEMTSNNTVVAPASFYYVFSNGTYVTATSLSNLTYYLDGTAVASNARQNIVWGIVPTSTTASGILPTTVKLFAVLSNKPTSAYTSDTAAEQDVYDTINYFPPDAQLKEVFVPIARTIVRPSASTFNLFGSGLYYKDLRGKILGSGGSATSTPAGVTGTYLFYTGNVTGNTANMTLVNGIIMEVGVYP